MIKVIDMVPLQKEAYIGELAHWDDIILKIKSSESISKDENSLLFKLKNEELLFINLRDVNGYCKFYSHLSKLIKCERCPIKIYTKKSICKNTPWNLFYDAFTYGDGISALKYAIQMKDLVIKSNILDKDMEQDKYRSSPNAE